MPAFVLSHENLYPFATSFFSWYEQTFLSVPNNSFVFILFNTDSEDGKEVEEEDGEGSKDGDTMPDDAEDAEDLDVDDDADSEDQLKGQSEDDKQDDSILKKYSDLINRDCKSPLSVPFNHKDSKAVFPTNVDMDSIGNDRDKLQESALLYIPTDKQHEEESIPVTTDTKSYFYNKSLSSSPVDYDQPLDLSRKPKTSSSSSGETYGSLSAYRKQALKNEDNKPLDLRVDDSSTASSHSLFNLEKRFGSKSTILEGLGSKHQPPRNPIYQAFGGNLFTNALYNQPTSATDQVYRPNRSYWSSSVSSVLQQKSPTASRTQFQSSTPVSSTISSQHSSITDTKTVPSNGAEKEDAHKHTNLICGCKRQFETLKGLIIHMEKTGHIPTSGRAPDAGEYPKLVRGQDMWLNQGSEQTRQILRCIKCAESFKTLPELTYHHFKTRHYENIVGAEVNKKVHKCSAYCDKCPDNDNESVFKCRECNQNFKDMDALASHMMISGHHRKRSRTNSESDIDDELMFTKQASGKTSPKQSPAAKVKKVLNSSEGSNDDNKKSSHSPVKLTKSAEKHKQEARKNMQNETNHIRCETCGDKIQTPLFVDHVRQCVETKSKVVGAIKAKIKPEEEQSEKSPEVSGDHRKENKNESLKTAIPLKKSYNCSDTVSDKKSSDKDFHLDPTRPKSPTSTMPVLHSTTPDNDPPGGSALKAMESFIERSFTGGFSKPSFFGPTKTNLSSGSRFTQYFAKSQKQECPLPDSTQNLPAHQKYLPPDFAVEVPKSGPTMETGKREETDDEVAEKKVEIKPDPDEKDSCTGNHHPSTPVSERSAQNDERPDSNSNGRDAVESPKPIHKKYLVSDSSLDNEANNNSALESLQGLVYGKSLTTEHPLDSLQKLIHNTDGGSNGRSNGSQSVMAGTATFQPGMPSTVILVNPIVTVVPNTSAPPAVQINISRDTSPPTTCQTSPSASSLKGAGSDKGGDSDGEPGEYRCQACSRTFMSKGSYRYHLSRCHLSTVKKYGFKEAFNMSPYVYLPLDHSAKFSKYYEMANELANKGSEAASPPPVSPEEVANQS